MKLLDLPREVLIILPNYLETLQDFHSLSLTCRTFHDVTSFPSSNLLFRLACSPYTGLQPYPHLLLATKARQLVDWAVQDDSRRDELLRAIKGGCDKVLKLGLKISPLTVEDLRRLHRARVDVLIPLSQEMDPICGPASRPKDAEEITVCENLILALTNFWLYCDMFHHRISASYSKSEVKPLSNETWLAWFRWCIPDTNCNKRDCKGQYEQLDLKQILPEMEAKLWPILTGSQTRQDPGKMWWVRCAFHTGLPALAVLKSKSADAISPEIQEVKDQIKLRINEGVDPAVVEEEDGENEDVWVTMVEDINCAWFHMDELQEEGADEDGEI
ncbi:hypothetical protein FRB97_008938 [Tulasnella sp. 331]|nr:hypothetical protein FRB97_008938 [Tulasnella sp. 331]